jgi:hypothetical protein
VVYLVVGLDAGTLAGWHRNILARDVTIATRSARSRAAAEGVDLLVAAVIGPNSSVVAVPGEQRAQVSNEAAGLRAGHGRADPSVHSRAA